jgi:hypothetical protein
LGCNRKPVHQGEGKPVGGSDVQSIKLPPGKTVVVTVHPQPGAQGVTKFQFVDSSDMNASVNPLPLRVSKLRGTTLNSAASNVLNPSAFNPFREADNFDTLNSSNDGSNRFLNTSCDGTVTGDGGEADVSGSSMEVECGTDASKNPDENDREVQRHLHKEGNSVELGLLPTHEMDRFSPDEKQAANALVGLSQIDGKMDTSDISVTHTIHKPVLVDRDVEQSAVCEKDISSTDVVKTHDIQVDDTKKKLFLGAKCYAPPPAGQKAGEEDGENYYIIDKEVVGHDIDINEHTKKKDDTTPDTSTSPKEKRPDIPKSFLISNPRLGSMYSVMLKGEPNSLGHQEAIFTDFLNDTSDIITMNVSEGIKGLLQVRPNEVPAPIVTVDKRVQVSRNVTTTGVGTHADFQGNLLRHSMNMGGRFALQLLQFKPFQDIALEAFNHGIMEPSIAGLPAIEWPGALAQAGIISEQDRTPANKPQTEDACNTADVSHNVQDEGNVTRNFLAAKGHDSSSTSMVPTDDDAVERSLVSYADEFKRFQSQQKGGTVNDLNARLGVKKLSLIDDLKCTPTESFWESLAIQYGYAVGEESYCGEELRNDFRSWLADTITSGRLTLQEYAHKQTKYRDPFTLVGNIRQDVPVEPIMICLCSMYLRSEILVFGARSDFTVDFTATKVKKLKLALAYKGKKVFRPVEKTATVDLREKENAFPTRVETSSDDASQDESTMIKKGNKAKRKSNKLNISVEDLFGKKKIKVERGKGVKREAVQGELAVGSPPKKKNRRSSRRGINTTEDNTDEEEDVGDIKVSTRAAVAAVGAVTSVMEEQQISGHKSPRNTKNIMNAKEKTHNRPSTPQGRTSKQRSEENKDKTPTRPSTPQGRQSSRKRAEDKVRQSHDGEEAKEESDGDDVEKASLECVYDEGQLKVKCPKCNCLKAANYIKQHLKTHTGEKSVECKKCGDMFQYRMDLKRHIDKEGCRGASCPKCGKKFEDIAALRQHDEKKECRIAELQHKAKLAKHK